MMAYEYIVTFMTVNLMLFFEYVFQVYASRTNALVAPMKRLCFHRHFPRRSAALVAEPRRVCLKEKGRPVSAFFGDVWSFSALPKSLLGIMCHLEHFYLAS